MKDTDWNDISFMLSGKHRQKILKSLGSPKTPTQIKQETGLHFASASRIINDLEKQGFVKCLTPKKKLFRFYQITEKGKEILKMFVKE